MKQLNKLTSKTLHEQLYEILLNDINEGKYKETNKIPTELELAKIYNISRVTVRKAIQKLVDEQILIKKTGKGTFINKTPYTALTYSGGSFTANCLKQNAVPSTTIISIEKVITNDPLLQELCYENTNEIIKITRIRKVNDIPCIVEIDYFPTSFDFLFYSLNEKVSILELVANKTEMQAKKSIDFFDIEVDNKEYSKYLNVSSKKPLLKVTQKVLTQNNKLIYINHQYILTDKYIYVVQTN